MHWNRRYIIKSYIRASLWLVPFFAVVLYMVLSRITHGIDGWLLRTGRIDETTAFFGLTMAGARSALDTIVTLNLSFLVFTFGSLLVAIQVAGGQYTPRIIATTLLRDNAIRFTVGYFVFTLLFAVRVLSQDGRRDCPPVQHLHCRDVGVGLGLWFSFILSTTQHDFCVPSASYNVWESPGSRLSRAYIRSQPRARAPSSRPAGPHPRTGLSPTAGPRGSCSPWIWMGLVAQAQQANGIIEFVPQVGDFVAVG